MDSINRNPRVYSGSIKPITHLEPNQVFVFGSNSSGFSCSGSAGMAIRGDSRNNWREDKWVLEAIRSPIGSAKRIGKWGIFGVASGFQKGYEGKSYAIITIEKPGKLRSYPLEKIRDQFLLLFQFANENFGLEFLMTEVGAGLAGYSKKEMKNTWDEAIDIYRGELGYYFPRNIIIPDNFYL